MRVASLDGPAANNEHARHRAKSSTHNNASSTTTTAAAHHSQPPAAHAPLPPDPQVSSPHVHGGPRRGAGGTSGGGDVAWQRCLGRMLARKPMAVVTAEGEDAEGKGLHRRLGLWDLLAIGYVRKGRKPTDLESITTVHHQH